MQTIRQLLDRKGDEVWTIGADASVYAAVELMAKKEVGALVVVDGARPVGIVSERDYARKVILAGRSSKKAHVADIMTTEVVHVAPEATVDECMVLMTERRIRHLPVVSEGRLIGMISIGDLVKTIIEEQKFVIEQLESYIAG